jgi:hypothetical protein
MTESERMTSRERSDLAALIRKREKVAKSRTAHVKAERLADFEVQLASVFAAEDERFSDLNTFAQEVEKRANEELERRCAELGIPAHFRPGLHLNWMGRGENATSERRAELRRVAQSRADADQKKAIEHIEFASLEAQEELLRDGLTTSAAREYIERLPTPEQLLPSLDVGSLLKALPGHHEDQERRYIPGDHARRLNAAALEAMLKGLPQPAEVTDQDQRWLGMMGHAMGDGADR